MELKCQALLKGGMSHCAGYLANACNARLRKVLENTLLCVLQ
jgi:hypothetical protein